MPELPEVETTRRGLETHLLHRHILDVRIREYRLRWPIARDLPRRLRGQTIQAVQRRAKYLLLRLSQSTLILHLGMSGSLRVIAADTPPQAHDHVDIVLDNGQALRLRDPRRFGSLHYTTGDPQQHELLRDLGPEPLEKAFDSDYLFRRSRKRKQSIKTFLMDSHVVVGVGNIYACEALFLAGIRPGTAAGRLGRPRLEALVNAVRQVLTKAIAEGGTTLRDFQNSDGLPGYFRQYLYVYGREGEPCRVCGAAIRRRVLGQRSTFYCPHCQR